MISLHLMEIYPCTRKKKGSLVGKFKKSKFGTLIFVSMELLYGILVWKLSQIPLCLGLCRKNPNKSVFGWFELEFEVD